MAKDRARDQRRVVGSAPDMKDIRSAYFAGKITPDEANDLGGTKEFSHPQPSLHKMPTRSKWDTPPTEFEVEHNIYHTHKRAGLSD